MDTTFLEDQIMCFVFALNQAVLSKCFKLKAGKRLQESGKSSGLGVIVP